MSLKYGVYHYYLDKGSDSMEWEYYYINKGKSDELMMSILMTGAYKEP